MWLRVAIGVCLLAATAHSQSIIISSGSTVTVGPGGELVVLESSGVEVQSGGALEMLGSSSANAFFTGPSGRAPITVISGGTVHFSFASFTLLSTFTLQSGGKLLRMWDTSFAESGGSSAAWIDISACGTGDRNNVPFSLNRVTFNDTSGTPARKSVKSGANTPLVRMLGEMYAHGNRWGELYDDDSSDRVTWNTGAVARDDGATFHTLEDALKSSTTTASSIITSNLGANAFVDDVVDWNLCSASSSSGPTVRSACLAPMIGAAVCDSDFDIVSLGARGKIINCVIGRAAVAPVTTITLATTITGGVSETADIVNCTMFPVDGQTMGIAYNALTRTLIGTGATLYGNTTNSSLNTATSSFFASASAYDLHLVSPGGNAAIDEAPDGTTGEADWEGTPRGIGGKSGGSECWDYGADEYVSGAAMPTMSHSTNTSSSITWSWTNLAFEVSYSVYAGSHSGGESALHTTSGADILSWEETSLSENTQYTRHVHANYSECPGVPSATASAYSSVHSPDGSDFSVSSPSNNTVNVTVVAFANQSAGLSGRRIERSANGTADWVVAQDWTSSTSTFVDTVAAGTWYYRVAFRNGDADATTPSVSESVSVAGTYSPPAPPGGLKAVAGAGQVSLTWNAGTESDLAGYNVYRSTTSGSGYSKINGSTLVASTSYTDTGVSGGTPYYYVVRAVGAYGEESSNSNEATATPSGSGALPPPQNLRVTPYPNSNHLKWDAVSGALGYKVYRKVGSGGSWTLHTDLASPPQASPRLVTGTEFRDSSLTNGQEYFYKVTAVGP